MDYSAQILKKLMYRPQLKFSQMQIDGMTSKHFTYYLKKLKNEKFIEKRSEFYYLTDRGKEFVGRLDEITLSIEKQPKVTVALTVLKEENNKRYILLNKRKKHPYYGKVGGFTGKVRFGESYEDCARRELIEETGLTGDFEFRGIIRKIAHKENEEPKVIVQDQLMVLFLITNPMGELIESCEENDNFWDEYIHIKQRTDVYNTFFLVLDSALEEEKVLEEIFEEAKGY